MPKFSPLEKSGISDGHGYIFYCPGCKCHHSIQINKALKPCWNFNGDRDNPTVSPSVLYKIGKDICHFFIKDGIFQFLNDCTHELKGQTIPLPEWDE